MTNVETFPRGVLSTSRRYKGVYFQCRDVEIQRRNVPERYIFNVTMLSPTSRRAREVHFQHRDVESNVTTFPRLTFKKFYKKNSKYRETPYIQIYSSQSFHKACHAISPSPRQPRNLETCNINGSKLKQEKLYLAHLKQAKMMTKIILRIGLPPK